MYIADAVEATSGSAYKVAAIAREWERRGHRVWLLTTRRPKALPVAEVEARLRQAPRVRSLPERIRGEVSYRASYPLELLWEATRLGVDVVYSRGLPPAPGLGTLLRAKPLVVEVNGDVARETSRRLDRALKLRARALLLREARGVVFVSEEVRRACGPDVRRSLVLANPCLPIEGEPLPPVRPPRPKLVLIGYARHDWAGIDKVVELAQALPELDFLVIGAVVRGPPNLQSVPPSTQAESDRLMLGCTVGLGPLALYRKQMFEASPLKARNYLALGLPVVQAYKDTDVTEADGCVLQIPNTEDNVWQCAERIREFAWRAYRDPELSARARQLAAGRLSLASKEDQRLAFIERCLSAPR